MYISHNELLQAHNSGKLANDNLQRNNGSKVKWYNTVGIIWSCKSRYTGAGKHVSTQL